MNRLRHWFVPAAEPLLELLNAQWLTAHSTLAHVVGWAAGRESLAAATVAVQDAIDTERDQQRTLHRAVRSAFYTPLDAEDIFELGERISTFHRQLYLLIREADLSDLPPDAALLGILSAVEAAARLIAQTVADLPNPSAADSADDAAEAMDAADDAYRAALLGLGAEDVRTEIQRRELYRRAGRVSDAALRIAHRAWYAVCKIE